MIGVSYLDIAKRIGERLCHSAIRFEDRCTWLGDTLEWSDQRMMIHRSFGGEFYDGSSGVAWFLGNLWEIVGSASLRDTAECAIRHALHYAKTPGRCESLGLYDGQIGIALVAARLGKMFDNPALVQQGLDMAIHVVKTLRARTPGGPVDLLSGNAGVALGLLLLGTEWDRQDLTKEASALGGFVLSQARRQSNGWFWSDEMVVADNAHHHNPCSYAHGNAGIAHAMDELCAVTGNPEFNEAASEAIRYERNWFDRRWSSWADLRPVNGKDLDSGQRPPVANHWCHGSVGIGLQRLRRYELRRDLASLAEVQSAVMGARKAAEQAMRDDAVSPAFDANFSVCHGLAGTTDLLIYAYEILGNEELLNTAAELGEFGYTSMQAHAQRWRCGLYQAGETPGLMLGLAGIGLLYLRLHAPGRFPPAGLFVDTRIPRGQL